MHSQSSLFYLKVIALAFCHTLIPEVARHLSLPLYQRELFALRPAGYLEVDYVTALVLPMFCVLCFLTDVPGLNDHKTFSFVTAKNSKNNHLMLKRFPVKHDRG